MRYCRVFNMLPLFASTSSKGDTFSSVKNSFADLTKAQISHSQSLISWSHIASICKHYTLQDVVFWGLQFKRERLLLNNSSVIEHI